MAKFVRRHPKTGELFHPYRYQDGLFRVADPTLGNAKKLAENQISISEGEIAEYIRRGFHLRMLGEISGQRNLIRPEEIEVIGGSQVAAPMAPSKPLKVSPTPCPPDTRPAAVPAPPPLATFPGALPPHGRISCADCFPDRHAQWGVTLLDRAGWRLTNNPMAWGGQHPETLVLGFSKGATQDAAILTKPHEDVAFARGRKALGRILDTLGLFPAGRSVDDLIAEPDGPMAFGSLVRCSVAKSDGKGGWFQSGGDILGSCLADRSFGDIITNCIRHHLADLPASLKLVVMLGNGAGYIDGCRRAIASVRPGIRSVNDVAYGDDQVMFVHTIHFAAQGRLVPEWCEATEGTQAQKRKLAQQAISGRGAQP